MDLVKSIKLPFFENDFGDLVSIESQTEIIPFDIKRVFNVRSPKNSIRGKHAHIECSQLLVCANGSIRVECDNGSEVSNYLLNQPNIGLLIYPGVWSQQEYLEDNTILTVICDQKFSEKDYIRSYKSFLQFIKSSKEKKNE